MSKNRRSRFIQAGLNEKYSGREVLELLILYKAMQRKVVLWKELRTHAKEVAAKLRSDRTVKYGLSIKIWIHLLSRNTEEFTARDMCGWLNAPKSREKTISRCLEALSDACSWLEKRKENNGWRGRPANVYYWNNPSLETPEVSLPDLQERFPVLGKRLGLHVFLGCVIELSVEMANFLIDVFESPEDFEVIFNTLATSTSSRELKELGKMFKELLESLRRELSRSRRNEGVEKLRRLIESWRLQAYEAIEDACMLFFDQKE